MEIINIENINISYIVIACVSVLVILLLFYVINKIENVISTVNKTFTSVYITIKFNFKKIILLLLLLILVYLYFVYYV